MYNDSIDIRIHTKTYFHLVSQLFHFYFHYHGLCLHFPSYNLFKLRNEQILPFRIIHEIDFSLRVVGAISFKERSPNKEVALYEKIH